MSEIYSESITKMTFNINRNSKIPKLYSLIHKLRFRLPFSKILFRKNYLNVVKIGMTLLYPGLPATKIS